MKLNVIRPGQVDYEVALNWQRKLLKLRQQDIITDTILLLEHPSVITLGKGAKENNILLDEKQLADKDIGLHKIERGGDVTYHGPGQIVGYPILDLKLQNKDIHVFVHKLEDIFIQLLKDEYNITAGRDDDYTGVWVGSEKITAIGLAVRRWVTMHGFAFNVNTKLDHFNYINPCGILGRGVTSLEKLTGQISDMDKLTDLVQSYFCSIYGYTPELKTIDDIPMEN